MSRGCPWQGRRRGVGLLPEAFQGRLQDVPLASAATGLGDGAEGEGGDEDTRPAKVFLMGTSVFAMLWGKHCSPSNVSFTRMEVPIVCIPQMVEIKET